MPDLLYYLAIISQLVVPCIVIVVSIIIMITQDESYQVYPYLTFQCVVEAGIFVSYMLYYRKPFRDDYDYWVEQRNALIQIKKRKKQLIDSGYRISSNLREPKI